MGKFDAKPIYFKSKQHFSGLSQKKIEFMKILCGEIV